MRTPGGDIPDDPRGRDPSEFSEGSKLSRPTPRAQPWLDEAIAVTSMAEGNMELLIVRRLAKCIHYMQGGKLRCRGGT